jgi:hypothetical protein
VAIGPHHRIRTARSQFADQAVADEARKYRSIG